jgi:D-glycero-D-manno-heptose 1,7-bisphosphate phosphatase
MRPAVFLDRDGTIIEQVHYLRDPAEVRLIPEAAAAIVGLRAAGYACVVVSNQSAVGRGLLTVGRLGEIHEEMCRQLRELGADLDGFYFCPAVPATADRTAVDHPDRKPGPGMLLRASEDLGLDLARSWMVGDLASDMHAGRNAGCRGTILVRTGLGAAVDEADEAIDHIAADLAGAADLILRLDRAERPSGHSRTRSR